MNLIIRADAGLGIGHGHVMRCLALAQAWLDRGGSATFLSRTDGSFLRERAEPLGIRMAPLSAPHPATVDLKATLDVLTDQGELACLVTDGYFFTPGYHAAVRHAGYPLLVIDDFAHLTTYHADIVLNQNLGAESLSYRHDDDTDLLLGPRFALLRQEFASRVPPQRDAPPVAGRILVTLGGGDPDNVTARILKAVCARGVTGEFDVIVAVGASNPRLKELEEIAHESSDSGTRIRIVSNIRDDMPQLMEWAEMSVAAGGSTCWELAYMGVPTVVVTLADNQVGIASALSNAGAAMSLGWHHQVSDSEIGKAICTLARDQRRREKMIRVAQTLVDGRGAARVVEALSTRAAAWESEV